MKKFRTNDKVVVTTGKYKGQTGSIISLDWNKNRVIVEKVNMMKKHTKPSQTNPEGGILEKEASINISNIALLPKGKEDKKVKIGFKVIENKKVRINKSTGKEI